MQCLFIAAHVFWAGKDPLWRATPAKRKHKNTNWLAILMWHTTLAGAGNTAAHCYAVPQNPAVSQSRSICVVRHTWVILGISLRVEMIT